MAEKTEEEESPAEEESNSDEDEVIPDIGGVPSLPSPPAAPRHRFCVLSLTLCRIPMLTRPSSTPAIEPQASPASLAHSQPSLSLSPLPIISGPCFCKIFPPWGWLFLLYLGQPFFSLGNESSPFLELPPSRICHSSHAHRLSSYGSPQ